MEKAIVTIPLYKTALSNYEMLSLKRSLNILGSHPFAIICPEGLDLSPLQSLLDTVKHEIKTFDPNYFKGLEGYNRLMLSEELYSSFANYEYILICQTDVYVFEDKLEYWCNKGYDYIGAPWIASKQNFFKKLELTIKNLVKKKKKNTDHFFKVGNGGFSLRKTETMMRIVTAQKDKIEYALQHRDERNYHIEDVYFSMAAPQYTDMKIPGYMEAVDFAMDRKPEIAYKLNDKKLPFGCHRFFNKNVDKFWLPIIDKIENFEVPSL